MREACLACPLCPLPHRGMCLLLVTEQWLRNGGVEDIRMEVLADALHGKCRIRATLVCF